MKNIRIIQKGNMTEASFDIRITEPNGKEYYYHFLKLEGGDIAIYSPRLYRLKGQINISWEDLPLEVKKSHYKELYPKDNLTSYEKNCFFYGKYEADKMLAEERRKEQERLRFDSEAFRFPIPFALAIKIYDEIGNYDKVEVLKQRGSNYLLLVDDKYIVKAKYDKIIFIKKEDDEPAEQKKWGDRINQIAKAAGTSFKFASVVGEISDTEEAIKILKRVHEEIFSEKFKSFMKDSCVYYSSYLSYVKNAITAFLNENLPDEYTSKIKISNKFCKAVKEEILKNNK